MIQARIRCHFGNPPFSAILKLAKVAIGGVDGVCYTNALVPLVVAVTAAVLPLGKVAMLSALLVLPRPPQLWVSAVLRST